jgi:hypothetical protein
MRCHAQQSLCNDHDQTTHNRNTTKRATCQTHQVLRQPSNCVQHLHHHCTEATQKPHTNTTKGQPLSLSAVKSTIHRYSSIGTVLVIVDVTQVSLLQAQLEHLKTKLFVRVNRIYIASKIVTFKWPISTSIDRVCCYHTNRDSLSCSAASKLEPH